MGPKRLPGSTELGIVFLPIMNIYRIAQTSLHITAVDLESGFNNIMDTIIDFFVLVCSLPRGVLGLLAKVILLDQSTVLIKKEICEIGRAHV